MTKRIAFLGFEIEEGKVQPGTKNLQRWKIFLEQQSREI